MGNRLVLVHESVTPKNKKEHLGIYLHWAREDDVLKGFVLARENIREYSTDPHYCIARLCQILANQIDSNFLPEGKKVGETSIGIGIVSDLDTNNWDEGVWYFDDKFMIVERTDGSEFLTENNK